MPLPSKLQAFVDSELSRAPVLVEQVRRQTIDALQRQGDAAAAPSPAERSLRFDLAKALSQHAQRFSDSFVNSLGNEVLGEPGQAGASSAFIDSPRPLALVDDASLSVDVELSRAVEHIGTVADWELRELQTFTSALSGQPYVSVASNPLRPEAFAHSLWQAARALGLSPTHQVLLLRTGSGILASAVQRTCAAACSRLEMEGVQPSQYAYRTGTQHGGNVNRDDTLSSLLKYLPAEGQAEAGSPQRKASSQPEELLNWLLQVIIQDTYMHPEVRAMLGRLQSSAKKLVRHDATIFTDADHPLWKLIDAFAFQSATHPNPADPGLTAWLGFAGDLITAMQSEPLHDEEMYKRTEEQLNAYAAAQFNAKLQQVSGDIAILKRIDLRTESANELLDAAGMETVPAALLDSAPAADDQEQVARWLESQKPGQWCRVYMHGRWMVTRLLWRSESGDRWLISGQPPKRCEALSRSAMMRLRAEWLIRGFVERDLVLRAARRLAAITASA